jgi:hypothetical protein
MTSRISIARRTLTVRFAAVAPPSPTQLAWRSRIEAVLRVAAPALDLLLAAGDRVSRAVDREEPDSALEAGPATLVPRARAIEAARRPDARLEPPRDDR